MSTKKLRVDERAILLRAITDGIQAGYSKAHKHTETPQASHIIEMIEHYIWLEIDEYFEFRERYS